MERVPGRLSLKQLPGRPPGLPGWPWPGAAGLAVWPGWPGWPSRLPGLSGRLARLRSRPKPVAWAARWWPWGRRGWGKSPVNWLLQGPAAWGKPYIPYRHPYIYMLGLPVYRLPQAPGISQGIPDVSKCYPGAPECLSDASKCLSEASRMPPDAFLTLPKHQF